jgi:hypothetical protein
VFNANTFVRASWRIQYRVHPRPDWRPRSAGGNFTTGQSGSISRDSTCARENRQRRREQLPVVEGHEHAPSYAWLSHGHRHQRHAVARQRDLAIENSPTDLRAQVFRQGYGQRQPSDFYVGDTIRATR